MRLEHPASCGGEVDSSEPLSELRIRNFGIGGNPMLFACLLTRFLCFLLAYLLDPYACLPEPSGPESVHSASSGTEVVSAESSDESF